VKNEDQPVGRTRKPMAGPIYAHDSEAQTVTKNFETAIPNIAGKSLIAVGVDYAPGAASPSHTHAKSAFIYAYVISGVSGRG
jgi:quercetin dioxygenase-like cupin family protein